MFSGYKLCYCWVGLSPPQWYVLLQGHCVTVCFASIVVSVPRTWRLKKRRRLKHVSLITQDSDVVMGTKLHRRVHSMQMLHLPWVVKAFAISVKTGFTSFGKVDLPFHAPVSQQSVNTMRHSSTGLEFYDHQENDFTPQKSSSPYLLLLLCHSDVDVNFLLYWLKL